MHTEKSRGCAEYRNLSRRQFVTRSAAALSAAVFGPRWLPRVAYGQKAGSRDVIVSIFLRGGCDGLTLCLPHGEDAYYDARPRVAVPRPDSGDPNAAADLDGFFGIPPAMAALNTAYRAGDLLFVHACGSNDPSRSHFDAQQFMEAGKARAPALSSGWLGRHLLATAPMDGAAFLRAIGMTHGLPYTLLGGPLSLPVPDPADFSLWGVEASEAARRDAIEIMYADTEEPLRTFASNTHATLELLDQIDFDGYAPPAGLPYPGSVFGKSMKAAAALIRADAGIEAIAIDLGGWDTHINQGSAQGYLANLMRDFADSLAAFHADIVAGSSHAVTAVVMSEFGRKFFENGGRGTDHGHGSVMLALGDRINGGQVLADWPGLRRDQLFQNQDLEVTIDYRDILAEIVQERLGNRDLATIFPDYTPIFRGVTT